MLKKGAATAGLQGVVRINKAGCMNQCGHGPMAVVYPEDVWYSGLDAEKATRILQDHVIGGDPVGQFRYIAPPGDNKLVDDA
ncbi:MAG: hypothetical protein MNPFHGCM_02345 [Gemmatimonadaceae bacterium]|nr:hypothetical protein [Gemmatimonadaceae bacterium]